MSNDFTEMARRVERLPSYIRQAVNVNIESVMRQAATRARTELRENDSVVTGELVSNTEYTRGNEVSSHAVSQVSGGTYGTHIVRSGAPHSPFVEYGTGIRQRTRPQGQSFRAPSVPPTGEIYEWMIEKGVTPRAGNTMLEAAELIAQSIAAYGQSPHPFMRPAWHGVGGRQRLKRSHARAVRTALRRL